jgi:hypothetical protein
VRTGLRIDPGYDIIVHFIGRAQLGAGLLAHPKG